MPQGAATAKSELPKRLITAPSGRDLVLSTHFFRVLNTGKITSPQRKSITHRSLNKYTLFASVPQAKNGFMLAAAGGDPCDC